MKKLFMLVALMFGLASCQNEPEDLNVVVGGEQDVMLTVSLPESTRGASSAGFDFTEFDENSKYDLRFILEISYNGKVVREVKTTETTSATFPVRLAPNKDYTFTVWADLVNENSQDDLYYNILTNAQNGVSALSNITFKEWTPNVEARDAYTLSKKITFNAAADLTMKLERPFAKVRVVATDIKDVTKFDIVPTGAKVEYTSELYTSFDAVSGVVAGNAGKINAITYPIVKDAYEDEDGQLTVFADYIFVPANGTVQFKLDVNAASGLIKSNNFNTAIPVVANKVTSIVGDVLTHGGNVSITVNNGIGQHETINMVDTADDLQEVINNIEDGKSGNVKLGGNIDLGNIISIGTLSTRAAEPAYGLLIPAGKSVVLDLNGFTISQTKTQTTAYSMIQNLGTLTIKDSSTDNTGKLNYTDNGQGGNYVSNTIQNSGVLTIYGGTIENSSSATVASNGYPHPIDNSGTLVINGGTFTNNANYSSMRIWCTTDDDTIVTIDGGTFNGSIDFQTPNASANKGTLTIKRGTFNADTYTKCAVRLLGFGADVDEMNGYIRGGQFNGAIALKNWSGSELNSKVFDITGGTFTVDPSEFVNDDYTVKANDGNYTVARKPTIAKIGDDEYTSLIKAIAAVQDGDTITLVANEVFTENNRSNNSGYWDGVAYSGDKSFTIDLGGNTVSQDGALNDYLFWIKNDGSKANTITIKNGTLDAGTSAYCALCTSTTSTAKITINLENVNIIGNNSKGAVAKIRGGVELNVKAGTVITGANNYVGIEAAGKNTVVNIYDNAKIYQNGTGSYVGAIVGASQNATMNIYGGYGKSAKCGIIVMSTGATINVSGGEWIANYDGTFANDNKAVLVSQNNRNESSWACKSILNVTGGTFKGGYNCYGDKAGDAQINIKGGNFNANPASYVAKGYEAVEENGVWTITYDPYYDYAKVATAEALQAAINNAVEGENKIRFTADIVGDVEIIQKNNVKILIDGANKSFTGIMATKGYGADTNVALKIANINFIAKEGADACILSPDRNSTNPAKYSNSQNVTVENCTFTDPDGVIGCAAVRHSDGGDTNWTLNGCSVDNTMHSILQVNNVLGKLTLNNCTVNSKNGANFNSCTNVEMSGCNFDVLGYAVRIGVKSGGDLAASKNFTIANCTLKSACNDGDPIIEIRQSAVNATIDLRSSTLNGTTEISGATDATTIIR